VKNLDAVFVLSGIPSQVSQRDRTRATQAITIAAGLVSAMYLHAQLPTFFVFATSWTSSWTDCAMRRTSALHTVEHFVANLASFPYRFSLNSASRR
jgi:hypothetical protein